MGVFFRHRGRCLVSGWGVRMSPAPSIRSTPQVRQRHGLMDLSSQTSENAQGSQLEEGEADDISSEGSSSPRDLVHSKCEKQEVYCNMAQYCRSCRFKDQWTMALGSPDHL